MCLTYTIVMLSSKNVIKYYLLLKFPRKFVWLSMLYAGIMQCEWKYPFHSPAQCVFFIKWTSKLFKNMISATLQNFKVVHLVTNVFLHFLTLKLDIFLRYVTNSKLQACFSNEKTKDILLLFVEVIKELIKEKER